MTNPKAHAPNAAQKSRKSRPIRTGPAQQPKRPEHPHWQPEQVPQDRAFAPTWDPARREWRWDGWSAEKHGTPAERDGKRAWWGDGGRW